MRKFPLALLAALVLSGCSSTSDMGDLPLMYEKNHAVLRVFSPSGQEVKPFDGELIQITGNSFSPRGVGILPGRKQVRYACPPKDDAVVFDYVPTITYDFEAGKKYDLRCVNGEPAIEESR